jgi:hypothetical protein
MVSIIWERPMVVRLKVRRLMAVSSMAVWLMIVRHIIIIIHYFEIYVCVGLVIVRLIVMRFRTGRLATVRLMAVE